MGTDINLFLEYKNPITNEWLPFGYGYYIPRIYEMFAKMAAVRTEKHEAIFQQKGLPDDLSEYIMSEYKRVKENKECCHSPSWLNRKELGVCIGAYATNSHIDILEYKALLAVMELFEENRCETRIVFWFTL